MSGAADDAPAPGRDSRSGAVMPPEFDARHLVRRASGSRLALVVVVAVSALPGLGDAHERFAGARPAWLAPRWLWRPARSWPSSRPSAACSARTWPGGRATRSPLRASCERPAAPVAWRVIPGGLIAVVALYGPLSTATAAILAYRTFQLGLPTLLGAVAFGQLERPLARSPAPAAICVPMAAVYEHPAA